MIYRAAQVIYICTILLQLAYDYNFVLKAAFLIMVRFSNLNKLFTVNGGKFKFQVLDKALEYRTFQTSLEMQNCIDLYHIILTSFGQVWTNLDESGRVWTSLDKSGQV